MNIIKCIDEYVKVAESRVPIFTQDIFAHVVDCYPNIGRGVVNEYITRYAKKNPNFVRYQKGIYFRTEQTPFGKLAIDRAELIKRTLIYDGGTMIGYETGPSYMNKIGLTTQIPRQTFIATAKRRGLHIEGLQVVRAKTEVSEDNYRYLQLLDMMDNRFNVSFDADRTQIFRDYIIRNKLSYEKLIGYATMYNPKVFREIANTARMSI